MKNYLIFFIGLVIGLLCFPIVSRFVPTPAPSYIIFSPEKGDQIIELMKSAKNSLDIDTYALTSPKVIDEIINAHERGVKIRIIMEKNVLDDQNYKAYSKLKDVGIEVVYKNKKGRLNHIKIIIVDGRMVIVGSHNLTESALFKNREASVVLEDLISVESFEEIFERDWNED